MNRKCKCKGCTERTLGCHSTCEAYKEFRAEIDARNKEIKKEQIHANYVRMQHEKAVIHQIRNFADVRRKGTRK